MPVYPFVPLRDWDSAIPRQGTRDTTYQQQNATLDRLASEAGGSVLVGLVASELFGPFVETHGGSAQGCLPEYLQHVAPLALHRSGCARSLEIQFDAILATRASAARSAAGAPLESSERATRALIEHVMRSAAVAALKVSFREVPGIDDVELWVDLADLNEATAAVDAIRALLTLRVLVGGVLLLDDVELPGGVVPSDRRWPEKRKSRKKT